MKNTLILLTSLLTAPLTSLHADGAPDAPSDDWEKQVESESGLSIRLATACVRLSH